MIPGENNVPPVRDEVPPLVDSPVPLPPIPTEVPEPVAPVDPGVPEPEGPDAPDMRQPLPRPKFPQVGRITPEPFDITFTPRILGGGSDKDFFTRRVDFSEAGATLRDSAEPWECESWRKGAFVGTFTPGEQPNVGGYDSYYALDGGGGRYPSVDLLVLGTTE